ncbi:MAG: hypothetical protein MSC30_12760 [Gaiellaceae bacterium MAG52_C11]|nr:hypothetical protein [Candidatus Gaiellasilicea maunaloa]
MTRVAVNVGDLQRLTRLLGAVVRFVVRLALAALLGVAAIAIALARGDFSALEIVFTLLLTAAPAILLLFAAGLCEVMRLPERLRRMPRQGADQLAELTRIAGEARTSGFRRAPSLLWRLRGAVGSTRDLVGFAVPLRVFTLPFLALTLFAAAVSVLLVLAGPVALVALAIG